MSIEIPAPLEKKQIINFSKAPIEIKTEEDLIAAISSYFDFINTYEETPTFTGLALSLGLTRAKLLKLPEDSPFTPILEKAKQYIVEFAEKQLFAPKPSTGVQFWLKNNDNWVDKSEIEVTKPKTIIDILNEIDSKNNQTPKIYDLTSTPVLESPEGESVEAEKPLQDYQQAG